MHGHDGRFVHRRMPHRGFLQRLRTDPLTAGLDDVFCPIDDVQRVVGINHRDIAGSHPAIAGSQLELRPFEIPAGNPMATTFQVSGRAAVARQWLAVVINDANFVAIKRLALRSHRCNGSII